jgi:hypothetical protein
LKIRCATSAVAETTLLNEACLANWQSLLQRTRAARSGNQQPRFMVSTFKYKWLVRDRTVSFQGINSSWPSVLPLAKERKGVGTIVWAAGWMPASSLFPSAARMQDTFFFEGMQDTFS